MRVASEPELFAADMPGSPIDRSFGSPTILTCDGEPHRDLRRSIDPKYRPASRRGLHRRAGRADRRRARLDAIEGARRGRADGRLLRAGLGAQPGRGARPRRRRRRDPAALVRRARRRRRPTSSAIRRSRRARDAACAEIDERARTAARAPRREPDESTISHMICVRASRRATAARGSAYLPSLKVILLGGMQEPGHGAGSVLYALLAHPEQLAEVARRPRRAAAGGDRGGHALDLADRDAGPADDAPRSSSAARACRPTPRSRQ